MYLARQTGPDVYTSRHRRARHRSAYLVHSTAWQRRRATQRHSPHLLDEQAHPSVEVPLGDFFGIAHGRQRPMQAELVTMQVGKGFNCWIPMPFRSRARITIENDASSDVDMFFYQVDFTLDDPVDADTGIFHAQFRRANPCPMGEDFTILDGVEGRGIYLGTVLGVRSLYEDAWWGEGEVKFYIDGDRDLPTICGTGTEDYMGSAWGLD